MIAERQKGHVYYRCQTKDCATKTVREESIEDAIKNALSNVRISDENIDYLTNEFEKRITAKSDLHEPKTFAMQIAQLEDRLDRLTDALIDRIIDTAAYEVRKESYLLQKATLIEAKEKQKILPSVDDLRNFLELIKSLVSTYEIALPPEKRIIVQNATSNRTVDRKNIYIQPANWLLECTEAIGGFFGGRERTRTPYLLSASEALYQVSYAPKRGRIRSFGPKTPTRN